MLCASELAYLAGTNYVPYEEITDPALKSALIALKHGVEDLACAVSGSALLSLRDEGAISMEYTTSKLLRIMTIHEVVCTTTGATAAPQRSLEYRLASQFGGKARGVGYLVAHSIPMSGNAWSTVVQPRFEALLEDGILYREPIQATATTTRHTTTTATRSPALARAETLDQVMPAVRAWAMRWASFQADEAVLATQLRKGIHAALSKRTVTRDDDSDD
ncbi:MAG: hypothetical protein ABI310_05760 [Microbacteriaceae bacterium]